MVGGIGRAPVWANSNSHKRREGWTIIIEPDAPSGHTAEMDEHVLAAVVRPDEAETPFGIEVPFGTFDLH